MSEQDVELVKFFYDAAERGDGPAALGSLAEDIEWVEAAGMPYGGVYRGPEAAAQKVIGPIKEDVDGLALVREEFIASAGTVAVVLRYTGTGKATGKALDVPAVHVWDLRDGKLVRFRQFIDTAKFAEVVPADVSVAAQAAHRR
jgi:ketosteroid isomerase-like protein